MLTYADVCFTGGGVDLGFPYGVYTTNLFPRIDSGGVDPLDPRITLDPVTYADVC